jgi:uncharacterized protein
VNYFYCPCYADRMISHTFMMAPSVGAKKEQAIWEAGCRDWEAFLAADSLPCMGKSLKEKCDTIVSQASELLDEGEVASLGDMLPKGEHWRLYDRFKRNAAYLDIETDGLSRDSLVTVLTVHRLDDTVTLVHGKDLDAESFEAAIGDAELLVTFNGSCFDVPVLANSFPGVDLDLPHYDLRFASRKVGYRGGLKPLEKSLGLERSEAIKDVDGAEAVRLWNRWDRKGDRDALDTLVEYNRADTVNLEKIADEIYRKLVTDHARYRW